jgi:hypothetical protein
MKNKIWWLSVAIQLIFAGLAISMMCIGIYDVIMGIKL